MSSIRCRTVMPCGASYTPGRATLPERQKSRVPVESGGALSRSLEEGWVSPSYGVKVPAVVLVWRGMIEMPFAASFLFSADRLSRDERITVAADLAAATC